MKYAYFNTELTLFLNDSFLDYSGLKVFADDKMLPKNRKSF